MEYFDAILFYILQSYDTYEGVLENVETGAMKHLFFNNSPSK